MLKADGYDDAILGTTTNRDGEEILAYDRGRCLSILERQGMSREEAVEYFEYNVAGAYMGEGTPIFVDLTPERAVTLEERLRAIVDVAKEVMGQADNGEPTHPSTLQRLEYETQRAKDTYKESH